jgi:dihydroorotate dehydrogenase (NAD+) catalytic subunit
MSVMVATSKSKIQIIEAAIQPYWIVNMKQVHLTHGKPQFDFFGASVHSPFGIAAGPLPTPRFIKGALAKGFDIVTLKSVRTDSFPLNPYPHVRPLSIKGDFDPAAGRPVKIAKDYDHPLAVANSFGIPSVKPAEWQPYFRESLQIPQTGQALLVDFQGTARGKGREEFVQDHVKGVKLVRETGANIIEINLSCPNEGEAVLACFDLDITERIVKAVREANPDIKLIIKITYFSDSKQLKELVKRVGGLLDGIAANNTIAGEVVDHKGKHAFPGRPTAGVSGAPIKWAGLKMTKLLKQFREEFGHSYKIIGIGGVLNAADFHEYRQAGADIVMSVTGALWNPGLAVEIKDSLGLMTST